LFRHGEAGVERVKFIESGTFREILAPVEGDSVEVTLGAKITLLGEGWRIVGVIPNPNRPDDRLVFVERVPAQWIRE